MAASFLIIIVLDDNGSQLPPVPHLGQGITEGSGDSGSRYEWKHLEERP